MTRIWNSWFGTIFLDITMAPGLKIRLLDQNIIGNLNRESSLSYLFYFTIAFIKFQVRSILVHIFFDPVNIGRDSCPNSGMTRFGATETPARHSDENGLVLFVGANERSARIALAAVFSTFGPASAKMSKFGQIARIFCSFAFFVRVNLESIFKNPCRQK